MTRVKKGKKLNISRSLEETVELFSSKFFLGRDLYKITPQQNLSGFLQEQY